MIITDKIYNFSVRPNTLEMIVINSKYFQRLKHIHQKGFSYKITPLKHSRYEHSLGVFILACKFNLSLEIRLAALLHDIAHGPFSHSLNFIFKNNHKIRSKDVIDNIFNNKNIDKEINKLNIYRYITGELKSPLRNGKIRSLSLDMLDNILRDGYYARYIKKFSIKFIINNIKIKNNDLLIKQDRFDSVNRILHKLNEKMYYSKDVMKYENKMLSKTISAFINGTLNQACDIWKTDEQIFKKVNAFKCIKVDQSRKLYLLK